MSTSKKGAMYLSPKAAVVNKNPRKRYPVVVTLLLNVILLSLMAPFLGKIVDSGHDEAASAWGLPIACSGQVGANMGPRMDWSWPLINGSYAGEKSRRQLMANEAFGHAVFFTGYEGETDTDGEHRDDWTSDEKRDDPATDPTKFSNDDEQAARVYSARTLGNCVFNDVILGFGNLGLTVAKVVTSISSTITTMAFSGRIVCDSPDSSIDVDCIDILWITGGDGSQGAGLIGSLTNSIYLPLLVLVALMVGCWVLYRGIIQRALREAMFGVIWCCLAVILGFTFLLKPGLLAKAPAEISNTLAGCVIAAFGGTNCLDDSPKQFTGDSVTVGSDKICSPDLASVDTKDQMSLISASLSCSIWKAFVLEPWTASTFGDNFANLDCDASAGSALIAKGKGVTKSDFRVNMSPVGTIENEKKSDTLHTTGAAICNPALFQLYVMTNAESSGNMPNMCDDKCPRATVDLNWYNLVNITSTSDTTWNSWGGGLSSSINKMFVGYMTMFTALLGSIVIIVIAICAVLYYISAIFLMAFAPLFFLIGVHPGKGKDILKGYGEMVLSNIFKYVASALFLIVALALYGGVLGTSQSPGMTFVIVLVLSLALLMYRKEIVDLIGTVNMGGTQLGKATTDRLKNNFSRTAKTTSGAVIGGVRGGRSGMAAAFTENMGRELKRPDGLLGKYGEGIGRGAETANRMNRDTLKDMISDRQGEASLARKEMDTVGGEAKAANLALSKLTNKLNKLASDVTSAKAAVDAGGTKNLMAKWANGSAAERDFAALHDLSAGKNSKLGQADRRLATTDSRLNRVNRELLSATTPEEKARLQGEKDRLSNLKKEQSNALNVLKREQYDLQEKVANSGELERLQATFHAEDAKHQENVHAYNKAVSKYKEVAGKVDVAQATASAADTKFAQAKADYVEANATADGLEKAYGKVRSNKAIDQGDMKKIVASGMAGSVSAGEAEFQNAMEDAAKQQAERQKKIAEAQADTTWKHQEQAAGVVIPEDSRTTFDTMTDADMAAPNKDVVRSQAQKAGQARIQQEEQIIRQELERQGEEITSARVEAIRKGREAQRKKIDKASRDELSKDDGQESFNFDDL